MRKTREIRRAALPGDAPFPRDVCYKEREYAPLKVASCTVLVWPEDSVPVFFHSPVCSRICICICG